VEILGIQQGRQWNCASLNEFRKFFGLKPHETFEEINPDPHVADQLRRLYDHPDFVEMYPGFIAEEAKAPMSPGVGICPTFSVGRAVLSDAVCLIRGDRFFTVDYHPRNLTNWGYNEVQYDLNIEQVYPLNRFNNNFPLIAIRDVCFINFSSVPSRSTSSRIRSTYITL
jgi:linoleate 10R-lipoxygenase